MVKILKINKAQNNMMFVVKLQNNFFKKVQNNLSI